MNRFANLSLVALCALTTTATVLAQDGGPPTPQQEGERAVLTRQGLLKVLGFYMAPLGGMIKNKVPFDAAVASKNATHIAQLGGMIPDVFAFDTRKGAGIKTKAKEDIWTDQTGFNSKAEDLVKSANALLEAAKSADQGATLKAAAAVGKSCGACHDHYRNK